MINTTEPSFCVHLLRMTGNGEEELSDSASVEKADGGVPAEDKQDEEQSPVEQVALTVKTTDDPTLPVCTFRMWSLGLLTCMTMAFVNQFFTYRAQPLNISSIAAQVVTLPLGHFLAAVLPTKQFRLPFTKSTHFTLNPGPFNVKEHVLITIFANSGGGSAFGTLIVNIVKALYRRSFPFITGLLIVLSSQMLGYEWAGTFKRFLVDSPYMWWPGSLATVSMFRALHEKDDKKGLSRGQCFLVVMTVSFCYYIFPGYFMSALTYFSWICWLYPRSVTMQQLGSGLHGLGLFTFSFDWAGIASFLSSPLVSPLLAIANTAVAYLLMICIVIPIVYWGADLYEAKKFPILSYSLFTSNGTLYDVRAIVNKNFEIDPAAYAKQGYLRMSAMFAVSYGFGFASIGAVLTHVLCFHGKDLLQIRKATKDNRVDIHTRLMKVYPEVPRWWWNILLVLSLGTAILVCEVYKTQLQLPFWYILFACVLSMSLTLPIAIIVATTNYNFAINVISEYIIGYILAGRPLANVSFKTYATISMNNAISFLGDLKLGHYMKIPPRSMFMVQIIGTIVGGIVNMGVAWWLLTTVPNICDQSVLPPDSPWTCVNINVFYDASVIWGLIGPKRVFGTHGLYSALNWFFLFGIIAPVVIWLLHKLFPKAPLIAKINMPLILGVLGSMPGISSVYYNSWIIVGFIFNYFIFKYHKGWWVRYNYVVSAGMDAGLAFMGICLFIFLQSHNLEITWWGNNKDNCPLAQCPTAPGIVVEGCPVFH